MALVRAKFSDDDRELINTLTREFRWSNARVVKLTAALAEPAPPPRVRSDLAHARRSFVRSGFALIEGSLAAFARHALRHGPNLSEEETRFLRGEKLRRGVWIKLNIMLRERVERTLPLFARALAPQQEAEVLGKFTGAEWQLFMRAIHIRHRVTHPSRAKDVAVTNNNFATVDTAVSWFINIWLGILRAYVPPAEVVTPP